MYTSNSPRMEELANYFQLLLKADEQGYDMSEKLDDVVAEMHELMGFKKEEDEPEMKMDSEGLSVKNAHITVHMAPMPMNDRGIVDHVMSKLNDKKGRIGK